jgi:hypothetical protein
MCGESSAKQKSYCTMQVKPCFSHSFGEVKSIAKNITETTGGAKIKKATKAMESTTEAMRQA